MLSVVQILLIGVLFVPTIRAEQGGYSAIDYYSDDYVDLSDTDLDGMSIMPVSCVNYMNGNLIKFQMFNNKYNFQCHSNAIGTYVTSISHYMRVHFNYLSLIKGSEFELPSDVGYLNCVQLRQSNNGDGDGDGEDEDEQTLYARIGCLERKTYTSTKLALRVYTDKKCSQAYDDGQTTDERATNGYILNGVNFDTQVSFRPKFYSCETCKPRAISSGFSRYGTPWYDDDAAAKYSWFDDWIDDYVTTDDAYGNVQEYVNNKQQYGKYDDDDFYTVDDDDGDDERRQLTVRKFTPVPDELEKFKKEFDEEQHRELYYDDQTDDAIQNWDMCTKLYKYSLWCDRTCRSTDNFRIDEWSSPDLLLLGVMCALLISTMAILLTNRYRTFEHASVYADDNDAPDLGVPPVTVGTVFFAILVCIGVMAWLRLVNGTLVMASLWCVVLLAWLVNVTFFGEKKEVDSKQENYTLT